jgi:hypothetical protein
VKPTNEQVVKLLESVLRELSAMKADLAKLTKTA